MSRAENVKHPWYYYFEEQPEVKREEMAEEPQLTNRSSTVSKPSFSLDEGIGYEYLVWLGTSCGGGKNNRESRQIGKHAMKYFMQNLGNNADDIELTNEIDGCCLSSASIFIYFLKTLDEDWKKKKLVHQGTVSKQLASLLIFERQDNTLRCFLLLKFILEEQRRIFKRKRASSVTAILIWKL